ncbi:hypothetical protein PENTCL1PPCAC_20852, partial [Pristionchus entomophagus]
LPLQSMSLEDADGDTPAMPIPLPNVNRDTLEKVIDWMGKHKDIPIKEEKEDEEKKSDDISSEDQAFFAALKQSEIFEVLLAANYLDIKSLLETACKTIANMIKGNSPEEIRSHFHIKNDFTPEEEE